MKIKMTGFEHCQFFVERKKRYCRMSVKKGRRFCGEHQSINDGPIKAIDERVSCPLDPTQWVKFKKQCQHDSLCTKFEPYKIYRIFPAHVSNPNYLNTWKFVMLKSSWMNNQNIL